VLVLKQRKGLVIRVVAICSLMKSSIAARAESIVIHLVGAETVAAITMRWRMEDGSDFQVTGSQIRAQWGGRTDVPSPWPGSHNQLPTHTFSLVLSQVLLWKLLQWRPVCMEKVVLHVALGDGKMFRMVVSK
jgi:hypothetical protein